MFIKLNQSSRHPEADVCKVIGRELTDTCLIKGGFIIRKTIANKTKQIFTSPFLFGFDKVNLRFMKA